MITGEIKINETLTLVRWEATNEGPDDIQPKMTRYSVNVYGIDNGHTPFVDEFDIVHWPEHGYELLISTIFGRIRHRRADGLTRRPPVE